jgi:LAS superfamily LD-carboxypeptidase LdcB
MNALELTGRAVTHVVLDPQLKLVLHPDVVPALKALQEAARADGHTIQVVSAFRSFDRQLAIWNAKWRGERPLLDANEKPLDANLFTPGEKVRAILLWSALPGTSRHHWGTDIDVIDRAALPPGRSSDLLQRDFRAGGCFHTFDLWLESNAGRFGFYRPYQGQGPTQAEPWHLSFQQLGARAEKLMNRTIVIESLRGSNILGFEAILNQALV